MSSTRTLDAYNSIPALPRTKQKCRPKNEGSMQAWGSPSTSMAFIKQSRPSYFANERHQSREEKSIKLSIYKYPNCRDAASHPSGASNLHHVISRHRKGFGKKGPAQNLRTASSAWSTHHFGSLIKVGASLALRMSYRNLIVFECFQLSKNYSAQCLRHCRYRTLPH